MSENVFISVCIPSYNKFQTIAFTIESVVRQSFSNWELIVIDDSDNDFTKKIVEDFAQKDARVKYIRNKERLGLVRNWNECIKNANYEYVYILHHDDFLMQGVLEAYNNFVKKYPACGLIHSNCYYVSLPYLKKTIGNTQDSIILTKGDGAVEKILFNNNLACSSVMVRKECYNKLGSFDESAWVSPDWEMWARIAKRYDIGHLDLIGCTVMLDNENAHLSAIEVSTLYMQQQYYYRKIISYFSENYKNTNPLTIEKAEKNLKNTIRGLSFHYIEHFKYLTAYQYLKKIRYYNVIKLILISAKSILKYLIIVLTKKKTSYKRAFTLLYKY